MRYTFLFFVLLISLIALSQERNMLPRESLQFTIGRSKHSSGDIRGISFNTVYSNFFRKKISWIVDVGGTLHDGVRGLFFNAPNGNLIDGSIRYTTGGIQSTFGIGYSPVRTSDHEFQIRLGGVLRYQSTSLADVVTILFPAGTGLPIPVLYFENQSPQRTFVVGGSGMIIYNYTINNKISIGIVGGFQVDSNGDNISQLLFSIGRRF